MLAKIANDNAQTRLYAALSRFSRASSLLQKSRANKKPGKPGNKKPDIIIGLEVARQAGKSIGCR
ncbi:hypothetical protein DK871_18985 [Pseudomonas sp. L13]|nr:hypothetical protein [Pseudomonas sp. L13]